MPTNRLSLLSIFCVALALAGCDPKPKPPAPTPTPSPTPVATPAPTPAPTPTPFAIDPRSRAMVLCYHRFGDKPDKEGMTLKAADFEAQLQALKDNGIAVIPMEDFLAWRRGEKNIPAKSTVITLDDGWISAYQVAWPILRKFGYPFTMFIYTDYVKGGPKSGGQSMTWEQIAEMRDAGVDIASHTVSHSNLRARGKMSEEQYRQWLETEIKGSKDILEQKLGIKVTTLAYPYGNQNEIVRDIAMKSGYEAAFTVYGQHLDNKTDPSIIGRYAVVAHNPAVFQKAISFSGAAVPAAAAAVAPGETVPPSTATTMVTQPMHGEVISDPKPEIQVNLATFGKVDPKTVEMRISGFGIVPAKYDEASQTLSYRMHQRLREPQVTVIVSGRVNGRKAAANWTFRFDPKAATPSPTPETAPASTLPPAGEPPANDEAGIPPMKPAE